MGYPVLLPPATSRTPGVPPRIILLGVTSTPLGTTLTPVEASTKSFGATFTPCGLMLTPVGATLIKVGPTRTPPGAMFAPSAPPHHVVSGDLGTSWLVGCQYLQNMMSDYLKLIGQATS